MLDDFPLVIFKYSNNNYNGIIIDIIIVDYFGCIVNKAVLEIYRSTKMER